MTEPNF